MARSFPRVVITGLGAITPIGNDSASIWQALVEGRSGIAPIQAFDASKLPSRIGGEIHDFTPRKYLNRADPRENVALKGLKMMARTIQLALVASKLAMSDAGAAPGSIEPSRFGLEFGATMISIEVDDLVAASKVSSNGQPGQVDLVTWGKEGLPSIEPLWMLKFLPNMPACHISILHDAQGPSNTITEGEVAGLMAIGEAVRILRRGQADFFLTGAADSKLSLLSIARHELFLPLTRRNEEPKRAVRPFDQSRDGTAIGEGTTVFAVETLEHAQKRGATIHAEILGFGSAFDTRRDGQGMARAMRAALRQADLAPGDIDFVSAHGLGSIEFDQIEAKAIADVFGSGPDAPAVFGSKGWTGYLGAASGPVELAFALMAMRHGQLPPTLNCDHPDPACPIRVHHAGMRPVTKPYFLKLGYTDLGQCAALVVRRWDG